MALRLLRKPLSIERLTSGGRNISVMWKRTYIIPEDKTYMGLGGENIHCLVELYNPYCLHRQHPSLSTLSCTNARIAHRGLKIDSLLFRLRLLLGLDVRLRSVRQQRRHVVDFPELPREARRVQEGAHVKAYDVIRSHTTA